MTLDININRYIIIIKKFKNNSLSNILFTHLQPQVFNMYFIYYLFVFLPMGYLLFEFKVFDLHLGQNLSANKCTWSVIIFHILLNKNIIY